MKTTLKRTEPYKMLKRTKQLRRGVLTEEGLAKSSKRKCFEEKGAVQNAIKNRTTKNWVEEDLSKFPIKNKNK